MNEPRQYGRRQADQAASILRKTAKLAKLRQDVRSVLDSTKLDGNPQNFAYHCGRLFGTLSIVDLRLSEILEQ